MNQKEVLTGSHPFVAENPEVSQPGFEPDMTSLKPFAAVEYINGLRKPSGDLPLEIKKSFRREITLAAVCNAQGERDHAAVVRKRTGAAALVPSTLITFPASTIWKFTA
jgi:hypothetical protein